MHISRRRFLTGGEVLGRWRKIIIFLTITVYACNRALTPFVKILMWFRKVKWGKNVQIIGCRQIVIRGGLKIGDSTVVTINARRLPFGKLYCRDSLIGRNNFISVGRKMFLGRYFFSSNNCNLLCATHNYSDPLKSYEIAPVMAKSRIWIQDNVFIGADVKIVGNVKIGYGSFVNSNAVIVSDVPPLSFVSGIPSKVVKRFDWRFKKWVNSEGFNDSTLPGYGVFRKQLAERTIYFNPHAYTCKAGWIY